MAIASMSTQHTPGPWRVHKGLLINFGGPGVTIADVAVGNGPSLRIRTDIEPDEDYSAEADASLLAAAPDLLEAAQAAWNCISDLPPTHARVEVAQMLLSAIAKATGEAT